MTISLIDVSVIACARKFHLSSEHLRSIVSFLPATFVKESTNMHQNIERDCCTRAGKAWTGCNKLSINGVSLHSNVIQHCLCSGLEFHGWSGLLSECLNCLENDIVNQFQYLLPAFFSINSTLSLCQFETTPSSPSQRHLDRLEQYSFIRSP